MSDLPRGWAEAKVGDTGRYINGFAFKPMHWGPTGRPIIRIQNLTDPEKAANRTHFDVDDDLVVRRGDLLVSWSATLDAFIWTREEAVLNQHIFRVIADEGFVGDRYLFYLLKQLIAEMVKGQYLHGSTMKHINRGPFLAHPAPIAPRREQDRIVAEIEKQFSRLDAATAALKRVQVNLKRYRASVLKAACNGRLVPTEAELSRKEGRDYEPADMLLQRILRERRARWEADTLAKMIASNKPPKDNSWKQKYKEPSAPDTANLPPLPEGWCWAGLEQFVVFQNGRPFPSSQYTSDGVKLLRPGNLHVGGEVVWNEKNTRSLPASFRERNPDLIVTGGELVMNLTAQSLSDEFLGRVCITIGDEVCLLNQRLARITPILIPSHFLLWALRSGSFRRFVDGLNTGSLIQHMFTSQLSRFALALPPLTEQYRISDEIEAQLSVFSNQERTVERTELRANSLRRAVLTSAFSGKLVIQDPNDEPASILLERIRSERNAMKQPQVKIRRGKKELLHV